MCQKCALYTISYTIYRWFSAIECCFLQDVVIYESNILSAVKIEKLRLTKGGRQNKLSSSGKDNVTILKME